MDENSEKFQFSWGKLKGKGGVKMDSHFYDSFTFDNVKYALYDCVYLFKNGDPELYIGKIVKIWEQKQAKKVKILWFFLPDEIQKYLGGPVMEKEIFLASGDDTGHADINPLEAIAGKCSVICISKDERNRQPSPREQAMADYIFYWFFDVTSCSLSDQLPEKIAGLEVNALLNPKDEQFTSIPDPEVQGLNSNVDEGLAATIPNPQSLVKEHETPVSGVSRSHSAVMENENMVATVPCSHSAVKEDQKPVAAIPLAHSTIQEDEEPVASTPPPQTSVMENAPRRTQNAPSGQKQMVQNSMG